MSFSDMAKKPGECLEVRMFSRGIPLSSGQPQPKPIMRRVPFPEKTIAQTNRPHAYFKVVWRSHLCHDV